MVLAAGSNQLRAFPTLTMLIATGYLLSLSQTLRFCFVFVRGLNDMLKKNSGLILGFDVFET